MYEYQSTVWGKDQVCHRYATSLTDHFSHIAVFWDFFFPPPPINTNPEWNLEPKRSILPNETFPYLIFCISKPTASKCNRVHVWPWARIAACKVLKGNIKKYLNDFLQRILFIAKKTKSLNKNLPIANITQ